MIESLSSGKSASIHQASTSRMMTPTFGPAGSLTGGQGERMPSEQELGMAQFQGKHVAEIAKTLVG